MKPKTWSLFEKYHVDEKGVVINRVTRHRLQRTVKGYTIGYYIAGKFWSLKALRPHLVLIVDEPCPF